MGSDLLTAQQAAAQALEESRDKLTLALELLERTKDIDGTLRLVGDSSNRLASAIYFLRQVLRDTTLPPQVADLESLAR